MGHYRYLPMLRSKAGEVVALANLAAASKSRMLPIIHIAQKPPANFVERLAQAWNGQPIGLDGTFNFGVTGSAATFNALFTAMGKAGLPVIPCIDVGASAHYTAIVQKMIDRFSPGLILKASVGLYPQAAVWVAQQLNTLPAAVDLVVVAPDLSAYWDQNTFPKFVTDTLMSGASTGHSWRSTALVGSAAPKDNSALTTGANSVPRYDWQLWSLVAQAVPMKLDYGDFGTLHPDLTEPPGIAMARATVSVRYTAAKNWIVLKGRPTTGSGGRPMPQQYLAHAKALKAEAAFGGIAGCWADDRIQQIAAGNITPGNRSTWAGVTANRHMSFVLNSLM